MGLRVAGGRAARTPPRQRRCSIDLRRPGRVGARPTADSIVGGADPTRRRRVRTSPVQCGASVSGKNVRADKPGIDNTPTCAPMTMKPSIAIAGLGVTCHDV
ncbi:hypothetical protein GCM10007967_33740 [Xylanimonas ulmi]